MMRKKVVNKRDTHELISQNRRCLFHPKDIESLTKKNFRHNFSLQLKVSHKLVFSIKGRATKFFSIPGQNQTCMGKKKVGLPRNPDCVKLMIGAVM